MSNVKESYRMFESCRTVKPAVRQMADVNSCVRAACALVIAAIFSVLTRKRVNRVRVERLRSNIVLVVPRTARHASIQRFLAVLILTRRLVTSVVRRDMNSKMDRQRSFVYRLGLGLRIKQPTVVGKTSLLLK